MSKQENLIADGMAVDEGDDEAMAFEGDEVRLSRSERTKSEVSIRCCEKGRME